MSYLTLRSSYIYFTLHSITFISYIWPFGDSHYADVALGENEFDTPGVRVAEHSLQPGVRIRTPYTISQQTLT